MKLKNAIKKSSDLKKESPIIKSVILTMKKPHRNTENEYLDLEKLPPWSFKSIIFKNHQTPIFLTAPLKHAHDQSFRNLYIHSSKNQLKHPLPPIKIPSHLSIKIKNSYFHSSNILHPSLKITTKPPQNLKRDHTSPTFKDFRLFYWLSQTPTPLNIPSQLNTWLQISPPIKNHSLPTPPSNLAHF